MLNACNGGRPHTLQLLSHRINFAAQRIRLRRQLFGLVDHGFLGFDCATGYFDLVLGLVDFRTKIFNLLLHRLLLDKLLLYFL